MRIATFNLESLDLPPRANRPIADRIAMLRPELLRADADVLCLQEVNSQRVEPGKARGLAALDALIEGTPYASFDRAVSMPVGSDRLADVHNLVTLSRWPIRDSSSHQNDLVPPMSYRFACSVDGGEDEMDVRFDRPVLETRITLASGQDLVVLNCHLRAPLACAVPGQKISPFVWKTVSGWAEGFCIASMKRNAQALEIRLLVDRIMGDNSNALIVVAGDFNSEDHESPLRIIAGAEQDTGNGDLAANGLVALDRGIEPSRRFSVIHQGRPQMLDHILASRSLYARYRDIDVFNEALEDEAVGYRRVDRPAGSYHALVAATFAD